MRLPIPDIDECSGSGVLKLAGDGQLSDIEIRLVRFTQTD